MKKSDKIYINPHVRHDREKARKIGETFIKFLSRHCYKIEIVGSIRRGETTVKDIEILAAPIFPIDLFGDESFNSETRLEKEISKLLFHFSDHYRIGNKDGPKQKQIICHGINIDLFIVRPPAQWGVLKTIRTGPAGFSKWVVSSRKVGGALPPGLSVYGGALWLDVWLDAGTYENELIPTPTEKDFFNEIQIDYMEPADRTPFWGV